jgi:hypothetical protein
MSDANLVPLALLLRIRSRCRGTAAPGRFASGRHLAIGATGWGGDFEAMAPLSELQAIDLRFEQHCEGGTTALHGVVHWGG